MTSPRANRVPERIKEILAELVTTLKDPRVGFVTITDVRTTPDFGKATVFWTVLGSPADVPGADALDDAVVNDAAAERVARERTAEGLASATPLLRREVGRRMRLRQVPVLEFVHDPVPAHGRRIEALLDEARPDR